MVEKLPAQVNIKVFIIRRGWVDKWEGGDDLMWPFKEDKEDAEYEIEKKEIREAFINYRNIMHSKNICLSCLYRGRVAEGRPELSAVRNPAISSNLIVKRERFICTARESLDKYANSDGNPIIMECPFYKSN